MKGHVGEEEDANDFFFLLVPLIFLLPVPLAARFKFSCLLRDNGAKEWKRQEKHFDILLFPMVLIGLLKGFANRFVYSLSVFVQLLLDSARPFSPFAWMRTRAKRVCKVETVLFWPTAIHPPWLFSTALLIDYHIALVQEKKIDRDERGEN